MNSNLFNLFKELSNLASGDSSFNVVDEPIDIDLQMEYFKHSKKIRRDNSAELKDVEDLMAPELTDEQLRDRMILLASIDDPRAFRILEEYSKNKSNRQHEWAVMALQESKMLIEGNLLNERQVFVSTGLGGRGKMLRYFVALVGNNVEEFAPYQQHVIQSEFETALKNNRSIIENVEFQGKYAALTVLIPLDVPCHQTLLDAVEDCNLYGNFLKTDFLITNVKTLTFKEIDEFVTSKLKEESSNDEIDFDNLDELDGTDETDPNELPF